MKIDISELEKEAQRQNSLIHLESIRMQKQKLSFIINYLDHLPNPYSSFYDSKNREFHIIIQRDAFMMSSAPMIQEFELPYETQKIKIDYRGNNLDELTDSERIMHFFPKLRPENKEGDKSEIDKSGYDGWL